MKLAVLCELLLRHVNKQYHLENNKTDSLINALSFTALLQNVGFGITMTGMTANVHRFVCIIFKILDTQTLYPGISNLSPASNQKA